MKKISILAILLAISLLLSGCTRWWRFLPEGNSTTSEVSENSESSEPAYDTSPIIFSVGESDGAIGETVQVPIYVSKSNAIVNADMVITYDSTMLKPVKTVDKTTGLASYTQPGDWDGLVRSDLDAPGKISVMMATGGNGADNCILFYVPFVILDKMASSSPVNIDVSVCGISDFSGNNDLDAVSLNLVTFHGGTVYLLQRGSAQAEQSMEESQSE